VTGPAEASDADLLEQATPVDEQLDAATDDDGPAAGATDADRAEQAAEVAPGQRLTSSDVPLEADAADALDQATVVPEQDDERR
jgi:hypothetical protein